VCALANHLRLLQRLHCKVRVCIESDHLERAERPTSSSKPCLQVVIVRDTLHVVQQHVLCGTTEGRRQTRRQSLQAPGRRTSKKTTGLSQRMALLSSAFAFAGVLHATSCTPGMAWK
jgi:hypothetical protein